MNLNLALFLLSSFFFGSLAVYFSLREEKTRKKFLEQEQAQKQRIYQISILKEIQDRIGYSLDVEKVIDVITGSLRNIFSYSTASSIVVKEDKWIFKTYVEETVSHAFIEQVKKSMLASLHALLQKNPPALDEKTTGVALSDAIILPLSSFFHIPLVISDKIVGLINISSTRPNLYKEQEMTVLYQITGQASNALSRLQEVLKSEEKKREDLTNMMVHELRAPLTAIKDSSEVLATSATTLEMATNKKLLDIIHDQSKMLLDQIGEILDAARLDAGKLTIQKKPQENIIEVIKKSLLAFTSQASKKQITLSFKGSSEIPPLYFDPMRISQVLNNLLSNSLKFTPNGGKITVKVEAGKFIQEGRGEAQGLPTARTRSAQSETSGALAGNEPRQDPQQQWIKISVSDTGIGISKEKQKYLFTKYSEASETKGSTGLGLYVVKGIVEAHGGTVDAKSEQGKGTAISFTLPATFLPSPLSKFARTVN